MTREDIWADARRQVRSLGDRKLARVINPLEGPAGPVARLGRELVNFSSNNYLDLSNDPRVRARVRACLEEFGCGAGGARLITGGMRLHEDLERHIARFKGAEAALVFSSGYLANLGIVQALSARADGTRVPLFFDRLAHASIVDAVMASRSPWRSFVHNEPEALGSMLRKLPAAGGGVPRALVFTEGVFSMDGDIAPLPALLELCEQHDAVLVVDDAHGLGTVGPGGRGAVAHQGIDGSRNLVHMGTLSKALGSMGGYVAGTDELRELLVNRARAFVFDTALAPMCTAAADEALTIIEEEPSRVEALQRNARYLRRALEIHAEDDASSIIPVMVGEADDALRTSRLLRERGFLVVAIRPPTVPQKTSRLRVSVMSSHTESQMDALAAAVRAALMEASRAGA
jgi:8-amino-7-oxononanoate synthase